MRMRFFFATLLATALVYGADEPSAVGTWKLNVAKSKITANPDAPREATLTITDNGFTYSSISVSGKKSELTDKGTDTFTFKDVPTGNPYVGDARIVLKENGKEVQRLVSALLPDGKTLIIYAWGVLPDGKPFSDVSYYDRVP